MSLLLIKLTDFILDSWGHQSQGQLHEIKKNKELLMGEKVFVEPSSQGQPRECGTHSCQEVVIRDDTLN